MSYIHLIHTLSIRSRLLCKWAYILPYPAKLGRHFWFPCMAAFFFIQKSYFQRKNKLSKTFISNISHKKTCPVVRIWVFNTGPSVCFTLTSISQLPAHNIKFKFYCFTWQLTYKNSTSRLFTLSRLLCLSLCGLLSLCYSIYFEFFIFTCSSSLRLRKLLNLPLWFSFLKINGVSLL